jgi:hypothetical protein
MKLSKSACGGEMREAEISENVKCCSYQLIVWNFSEGINSVSTIISALCQAWEWRAGKWVQFYRQCVGIAMKSKLAIEIFSIAYVFVAA